MSLPLFLVQKLRLPVIAAPLFIISNPSLVLAQCKAGVVGSFPALNARPKEALEEWLQRITGELAAYDEAHPEAPAAPFAVNQIVHRSNDRLEHDLEMCVKYKVPIVITSLGARTDVFDAVHSYGGIVLHDIINVAFAHKAIDKGADGLIAVAAGAGGHAGTISPFALVAEIRSWFDGPLALSGAISTGGGILAARAAGGRRRLYRLGVHRHRRSQRRRGLQAGRGGCDSVRHRLFEPVHRRAWQLLAQFDRGGRARSGRAAAIGSITDEFWVRINEGLA